MSTEHSVPHKAAHPVKSHHHTQQAAASKNEADETATLNLQQLLGQPNPMLPMPRVDSRNRVLLASYSPTPVQSAALGASARFAPAVQAHDIFGFSLKKDGESYRFIVDIGDKIDSRLEKLGPDGTFAPAEMTPHNRAALNQYMVQKYTSASQNPFRLTPQQAGNPAFKPPYAMPPAMLNVAAQSDAKFVLGMEKDFKAASTPELKAEWMKRYPQQASEYFKTYEKLIPQIHETNKDGWGEAMDIYMQDKKAPLSHLLSQALGKDKPAVTADVNHKTASPQMGALTPFKP